MSWYAIAYVALILAGSIYSTYDDIRDRVASWYILVDGAVGLLWIYFVVAYYHAQLALPGPALALLLVLAIVWAVFDVRRELHGVWRDRSVSDDPELSPSLNRWIDRGIEASGVAVGVILLAPAIIAAIAVVRRAQ